KKEIERHGTRNRRPISFESPVISRSHRYEIESCDSSLVVFIPGRRRLARAILSFFSFPRNRAKLGSRGRLLVAGPHADAVAPLVLGPVQRLVGAPDQFLGGDPLLPGGVGHA